MTRYTRRAEALTLKHMFAEQKWRFDSEGVDAALDLVTKRVDGLLSNDPSIRLDAGESVFIARQLIFIQAKMANTLLEPLDAVKYVPIDTSIPAGAQQFSTLTWTQVGQAAFITNWGSYEDFPSASMFVTEALANLFSIGNSYEYSMEDLRRAAFANVPLDGMKAAAARQAHETKIDTVLTSGDTVRGFTGLMNNASVPLLTAGGGTITGAWESASATTIKNDLAAMVSAVVLACAGHSELYPNAILIDDESYEIINQRPATTFNDTSILRSYLDNSPYITDIGSWVKLRRAGAAGVRRALVYRRDPKVLDAKIPMAFMQHPPQQVALAFKVLAESKISGVTFYKPMAALYADGLSASTPA